MAVAITLLDQGTGTAADPSVTDSDITPTTGAAVFVACSATITRTISAVTGCGLTWTPVHDIVWLGANERLHVYRATATSPTTGKLSFNMDSVGSVDYIIFQATGVDTATNDGVVQATENSANALNPGTLVVTLAAFGSADNATVGCFLCSATTVTPGSGFTEIAEEPTTGPNRLQAEYKLTNDTSVDVTFTNFTNAAGIAMELKAGSAATNVTPTTATATGTANNATIHLTQYAPATTGAGTGTANNTSAKVSPSIQVASGTGVANDASVFVGTVAFAETATGAGVANDTGAAVAPSSGAATGTGTANDSGKTVAPTSEAAAGTGTANDVAPVLGSIASPSAAEATGTAYNPGVTIPAFAECATGTGVANDVGVRIGANASPTCAEGIGVAGDIFVDTSFLFTPPTDYLTPNITAEWREISRRFARLGRGHPRGRVLIMYDDDTQVIEASMPPTSYNADGSVNQTAQERTTAIFQGGVTYEINATQAATLEAAGYR